MTLPAEPDSSLLTRRTWAVLVAALNGLLFGAKASSAAAGVPGGTGLVQSSGGVLSNVRLGANLTLSGGTLEAAGPLAPFTPSATTTPVTLPVFAARFTHVEDFGARGDCISLYDAVTVAGQDTLASPSHAFTRADVGKGVTIRNGAGGGADLVTSIASVSGARAVLATAPGVGMPLATLTDLTVAVNVNVVTSAGHTFTDAEIGLAVSIPGAGTTGIALQTTITAVRGNRATLFNYPQAAFAGNGTLVWDHACVTFGSDDGPSINAAIAAVAAQGGELLFQARNYFTAETIMVPAAFINLRGKGPAATRIVGALHLERVIELGTGSVETFYCGLGNLAVSRAEGVPPAGSYGLYAYSFNYIQLDRLLFENHGIGLELGGVPMMSISGRVTDCVFRNCTQYYLSLGRTADLIFNHLELGTNCGNNTIVPPDDQAELYCPVGCVYIHDSPEGGGEYHFNNCLFLPRGPIPLPQVHVTRGIVFHNTSDSALYYFDHCYAESITSFLNTDHSVARLNACYFTSGGYTCGFVGELVGTEVRNLEVTNFFDLDPATHLGELMFTAVKLESTFVLSCRIGSLQIIGGIVGIQSHSKPAFRITGTDGFSSDVLLTGLKIFGDAYLEGHFQRLQVLGVCHEFNTVARDTAMAGAQSNKRVLGCIGDVCWPDAGFVAPTAFTHATLPGAGYTPGQLLWCSDARLGAQGPGKGTGSTVQSSGGAWVMMDGAPIRV